MTTFLFFNVDVAGRIKCGYEISSCKYLKTGEIDPNTLTVKSNDVGCQADFVLYTSKENQVCCQYVVQTKTLDLASNTTEALIDYKKILEEIRDKPDVIKNEIISDIIAKIKIDFTQRFL